MSKEIDIMPKDVFDTPKKIEYYLKKCHNECDFNIDGLCYHGTVFTGFKCTEYTPKKCGALAPEQRPAESIEENELENKTVSIEKIVSSQYLIHDFYENNSFSQDYWGTCEPLIKEYTQWLIDNGYIQYKVGCEPKKSDNLRLKEEKRSFTLQGCKHRLTLTELRSRLDGTPTKHVLAVWDNGERART